MSEPTPEPVHPGILAHVENWLKEHVAPELEAVGADAAKALSVASRLAPVLAKLLGELKTLDPALAAQLGPLVAEVDAVLADLGRL